jgi:hypothetical protein
VKGILRVFNYPELLFIALVIVAPIPIALLTSGSSHGFLVRLLSAMVGGFIVWLIVILLIVWPRYRH